VDSRSQSTPQTAYSITVNDLNSFQLLVWTFNIQIKNTLSNDLNTVQFLVWTFVVQNSLRTLLHVYIARRQLRHIFHKHRKLILRELPFMEK